MFKFLVTSDWHLEALANHFPTDHVERQLSVLDRIYQYALTHGIDHIFVPGDITDKHRMSDDTKKQLLQFFLKYDDDIHTHYIGGNHDWADQKSTSMDLVHQFCRWEFLKRLHVYLRPTQIEEGNITINMLPHPAQESIASSRPCLNFCHIEQIGALGDNGRPLRVKKSIQVADADYTISGHIHLYQNLKSKRFLYCGSPYQKTFGEALPKGFIECKAKYVRGELVVRHRFVDSKPSFQLRTVQITEQSQWSEIELNPAIRYRVYCDDSVTVPADIRTRLPNIAQLLKTNPNATIDDVEKVDIDHIGTYTVDPLHGLEDWLKSSGIKRKLRLTALEEAKTAAASF